MRARWLHSKIFKDSLSLIPEVQTAWLHAALEHPGMQDPRWSVTKGKLAVRASHELEVNPQW